MHRSNHVQKMLFALLLLFTLYSSNSIYAKPNAPTAPTDTPTLVVSDDLTEWTLSNGMLYWAYRCLPGPDVHPDGNAETNIADNQSQGLADDPYYLRRQPLNGGVIRTLDSKGISDCLSYMHMTADETAVYYYNQSLQQIEKMPVSAPDAPPVVLTTGIASVSTQLLLDDTHIYWGTNSNLIRRIPIGGGTAVTVVNTSETPQDMLRYNNNIYWIAIDGLSVASTTCNSLPCTPDIITTSGGHYLSIVKGGAVGVLHPNLYWTDNRDSTRHIRRLDCGSVGGCVAPPLYSSSMTLGKPITVDTNPFTLGDSHLLWTESDFGSAEGRLRRMEVNGGAAEIIAGSAEGISPYIDYRLATADGSLYFADKEPGAMRIEAISLTAPAIARDVTADAWEVNQAIQNLNNDVPLVANKTTVIRAYGRQLSGSASGTVDAWLVGTRDGNLLSGSPLSPVNGAISLQNNQTYDRSQLDDGWLFQLPASWTEAGTIHLELIVDPRGGYTDTDRSNNTLSDDFTFIYEADPCIFVSPIRTHQPLPSLNDPNFWETIDRFSSLWDSASTDIMWVGGAIEELETCWASILPYPCFGPYELTQGWDYTNWGADTDRVIAKLILRQSLVSLPSILLCDPGATVHSLGMVHPDSDTNGNGYANLYLNALWVKFPEHDSTPGSRLWEWPRSGNTLAQEVAHNFTRRHVDCEDPTDLDNNYPYDPCTIDDRPLGDPDTHFGFDTISGSVIPPNEASDYMSYGEHRWVSDYTFTGDKSEIITLGLSSIAAQEVLLAEESVIIMGGYEPMLNEGRLDYAYSMPTDSFNQKLLTELAVEQWQPSATGEPFHNPVAHQLGTPHQHPLTFEDGPVHLRLISSNGAILDDRAITLLPPDSHGAEFTPHMFVATFPKPAGNVARIELLHNEQVLHVLHPGLAAPVVQVLSPGNSNVVDDSMTVRWKASDADNDHLLFHVHYSPDEGANWFPLATDYPGLPDSDIVELTIAEPEMLPGSNGRHALIRITASDGYNTTIASSPLFEVTERLPQAYIASPESGQSLAAEQLITLQGAGYDPESGSLDDAQLEWEVDGEVRGNGRLLLIGRLSPGEHLIKLTATDADGNQSVRSQTITVNPLPLPFSTTTPKLDGRCDDNAYAESLPLSLSPYPEGGQATVRLVERNDNLYVCFSNLDRGDSLIGKAGVRIDVDNSRDNLAQSDDYGFFVAEDGTPTTTAGNGSGAFNASGPGGLTAHIASNDDSWSAELRIDVGILDDLDQIVNLALEHYGVTSGSNSYSWPRTAVSNQPNTWAAAHTGFIPHITGSDPDLLSTGMGDVALTVAGSGFADDAVLYWNGVAQETAVSDSNQLSATIVANLLTDAGSATITIVNPDTPSIPSNLHVVTIHNPLPMLTTLTPDNVLAENDSLTLTISGQNFVDGAQVTWDGDALETTFVNSTTLEATVHKATLVEAGAIGITVINPSPQQGGSNILFFTINLDNEVIYLPMIMKP